MGVAEFHQAGPFGIFHHAAFQRYGPQLVRCTAAWPHRNPPQIGLRELVGAGTGCGKAFLRPAARCRLSGAGPMDRLGEVVREGSVAQHEPIGLIAPPAGLAQLNERSREIFRQIVESYLATGEPVGSRNISRLIAVPLSPASVSHAMSDLEQLGLIYSPHTSAWRPA